MTPGIRVRHLSIVRPTFVTNRKTGMIRIVLTNLQPLGPFPVGGADTRSFGA